MKIAVDAGAICGKKNNRFGNYFFTENLLRAFEKFDQNNDYRPYTFCEIESRFKYKKLPTKFFRLWGMFDDIALAINQMPPLWTRGKIISFCHGLSYYFYPQYYSKKDVDRLKKQLKEMVTQSDIIIVSSQKVKDELVSMYRYIDTKIKVIPFGIPEDMNNSKLETRNLKLGKQRLFLYVGMNHPIKNIDFIIKAFQTFIKDHNFKDYKLFLVGDFSSKKEKNIQVINSINRKRLQQLYQKAAGLLTASHYESFNFPALEALANNCPVIGLKSAIIPEMKEFVNICDNNIEEFVLKMKNSCLEKKEIDRKKLVNIFSWREYIEKLTNLYD